MTLRNATLTFRVCPLTLTRDMSSLAEVVLEKDVVQIREHLLDIRSASESTETHEITDQDEPQYDVWEAAEGSERRVLIQELIERVTIFPDNLEVTVAGAPALNVLYSEVGLKGSEIVGVGDPRLQICYQALAACSTKWTVRQCSIQALNPVKHLPRCAEH